MISLSYKAISTTVQAHIALRHHLHPDHPAFVTDDHSHGLNKVIEQAFAQMCMAVLAHVRDIDMDREGDALTIELDNDADAMLRPLIESAMTAYVLYQLFEGIDADYASSSLREFEGLMKVVRSRCDGLPTRGIQPHSY